MIKRPDPSNDIRVKVMDASRGSVMLRCISAALLTWMALRTCLMGCDVECHKRLFLSSLNTNWLSDEMVKRPNPTILMLLAEISCYTWFNRLYDCIHIAVIAMYNVFFLSIRI